MSKRTNAAKDGRVGVGLLLVGALLGFSRDAHAVAAPQICIPARMAPAATTIPHNFPGFGYDVPSAQMANIHLLDTTKGGGDLPLTIGPLTAPWNKVVPQAGFTIGDSYTLTFESFCYAGATMSLPIQKPISFTIVADAPIPTTLGDVSGTPTFTVKNHGTSELAFDAIYTLSAEMKPWASVYDLAFAFDGHTLETHPTVSAGADSVHLTARGWCDDAASKTTKHLVKLTASLPFSPTLETATTELDFTCPAPHIVTPTPANLTAPAVIDGGDGSNGATGAGTHSGGCSAARAKDVSTNEALGGLGLLLGMTVVLRTRSKKEVST